VYVKKPPFNFVENGYQAFKNSISTRQGVVYVAANDGMLHAFNADTGDEMWGYIPSFVLPKLKVLADNDYANQHRYLVDGSPTVSDIDDGSGKGWKTILVAGLNAGGNGYYALDVTNPSTPRVMWEFTDATMGLSFANPIVAKLADGTWVVAVTSGYNNSDGVGRLYVLDANSGALKFTISTGVGTAASPSGLGKISAFVQDGLTDNTIERIYGGDLLGNVWRFDVNDALPPTGRDAMKLATLLVGTTPQPITTKPELGFVTPAAGGLTRFPVVFVGTGRYLGGTDVADTTQQSIYAIKDELTGTGVGNPRTNPCFVQQSLIVKDTNTRTTSGTPVDFATVCGWFMDFNPGNTTPGERVNVDMRLQLGVLGVITNIPEKSVCTAGGSSFIYFLDYSTGSFVPGVAGGVAGQKIANAIGVGLNVMRMNDGRVIAVVTTSDDKHPQYAEPHSPVTSPKGRRVMWRELLQ